MTGLKLQPVISHVVTFEIVSAMNYTKLFVSVAKGTMALENCAGSSWPAER